MKRNEVEPFNDIWYKDCFYNGLMPIIKYFNGSIDDYIVNDLAGIYKLSNNQEYTILEYDSQLSDGINCLNEIGITLCSFNQCDNLVSKIIELLNNDNLVMTYIDCFYEPIRKDTFHQNHWPHVLLIYGYDEDAFYINESEYIDDVRYKKMVIHKQELEECVNGYNRNFNADLSKSFLYSFSKSGQVHTGSQGSKNLHKLLSLKNQRLATCTNLIEFGNGIYDIDFETMKEEDGYIRALNNVINNLSVEQYVLKKLNFISKDNTSIFQESLRYWQSTRAIIAKCIFTRKNSEKSRDKILDNLRILADIETNRIKECNILIERAL